MSRRESLHFVEPHPSVPSTNYLYSGRGGAGNLHRYNPKELTPAQTASGPASRVALSSARAAPFFTSGRGGAGNVHREHERAIFSFDEELERQRRVEANPAPVYHVGRGGAGNLVDEMKPARKGSAGSVFSDESAASSSRSRRSIGSAWGKVARTFSRS